MAGPAFVESSVHELRASLLSLCLVEVDPLIQAMHNSHWVASL